MLIHRSVKTHFMMMHSQVEKEEILERYVSNRLGPAERQAFEEHFFGCDECFEKLQATERFAAGMGDAANRGLLQAQPRFDPMGRGWFPRAFAATACVALILALLAGWAYFAQMPRLRRELRQTAAQLEKGQQPLTRTEAGTPTEQAEANVPLVILQTSRAEEETDVLLKPDDQRLVLWIEPGPSRYREFRMQVFSSNNDLLTSLDHLTKDPYGALAASVPTKQLPAGDFHIKLTGQVPSPAALAGEYHLKIRRR